MVVENTGRDPLIDMAKGTAILLVVFGHALQYGSGLGDAAYDTLPFRIIYSFHMPLFALLSGWLLATSLARRNVAEVMHMRLMLLWPIAACGLLGTLRNGRMLLSEGRFLDFLALFPVQSLASLWFLWALLYATVLLLLLHRWGEDNAYIAVGFITAVLLLLPDPWPLRPWNFLLPFFAIGYGLRRWIMRRAEREPIGGGKMLVYMYFCGALWPFLLFFFSRETMIYFSSLQLLGESDTGRVLLTDLLRLAIGLSGSVLFLLMVGVAMRFVGPVVRPLAWCSRNSLGIYVMQSLFFWLIPASWLSHTPSIVGNTVLAFFAATLFSVVAVQAARLNRWSRLFLLAGR